MSSGWQRRRFAGRTRGLARAGLSGHRRVGVLPVPLDLRVGAAEEGVRFGFTLPRGAYATSLLREFMGGDAGEGGPVEGEMEEGEKGGEESGEEEDGPPLGRAAASWVGGGLAGWRLTTDNPSKERKALREASRLIDDALGRRQACSIASCGGGGGARGLALLRCDDAAVDVVGVARAICGGEGTAQAARRAPHVIRLLPVQSTCEVEHGAILAALKPLLAAHTDWARTFAVLFTRRAKAHADAPSRRIDRDALVDAIVDEVEAVAAAAAVSLDAPETAILVDVFDGGACLAVVGGWMASHECNLRKSALTRGGV